MTEREGIAAELRLAGRVARDLYPASRLGSFLLALAHDVEVERVAPQQAKEHALDMIGAVVARLG